MHRKALVSEMKHENGDFRVSSPLSSAIHFIADDQGAFIGALGMLFDASGLLGAPRSKVRLGQHYAPYLSVHDVYASGSWLS